MVDEVARWLFDPVGLTPHGFCLLWEPGLLWLHALSDIAIGLAYFSIPFALVVVVRRRPDLAFRPIFGLFAAFILLCGTGHWLDMATLWVPAYGVEGLVKALTAVVSVITAIALWTLIPQAIALPSHLQLRTAKQELRDVQQAERQMAVLAAEASSARDQLAQELSRSAATQVALRESEERFRLLLHSNVADALYLIDPDGNVETWNSSAERVKGYTAEEIIGRNFAVLFAPEAVASGAPAHMLERAREVGHFATEGWRLRKNGSRFLARVGVDAIHREDGSVRAFAVMTRDITNERIEEEQRAIIIEAAPTGMMIVDEAGTITLANSQAERIFGYPDGALAGQPVEILVPEDFRARHGVLRSAFTSGRSDQAMAPQRQFPGRRQDGSPVTIEIMLRPVKTPRGRIVVASLFDVTDRVRLAAEREETERQERMATEEANTRLERLATHLATARDRAIKASRTKSRFLAGMSHELRTPLNGILGYAHLLHLEGGLNLVQKGRVDAMRDAGKHLLEMITCVLDLSEIEAEHVVLHPAVLDVPAIAAACIDLVRPMAEAKGLTLSIVTGPGALPELVADAARLRQILLNLLGNAAKFTASGTIALRLRRSANGSKLRIEVADTGPGIPADRSANLFQEFERLDTEASHTAEGAGLGLALSAQLARVMGGTLGYENNPAGGSIFWLELPLKGVAGEPLGAAATPDSQTAEAATAPARTLRVLVVDDVLMNRDVAGSFLRMAGHTVVCVEGGAEAVAAVAGSDFDVVLMDVRMPEMDGLEATRRIRALPGARGEMPIVALTAQTFTEQVAACRAAGMDTHLAKPFDPDTLLAAVAQAVAAGRTRVEPTPEPKSDARPEIGSELPIFNQPACERTAAFLTPEVMGSYLRTITERCEVLLNTLRAAGALSPTNLEVADMAHMLAGSAGMFGFDRLASVGRQFEVALRQGAPEAPALAERLADAIRSSIDAIDHLPVA